MIPAAEYVPPEPPESEHWFYPGGREYVDHADAFNIETRTWWSTQTANQAIGTGVLVGRWISPRGTEDWDVNWKAQIRAKQSARIGWGAL